MMPAFKSDAGSFLSNDNWVPRDAEIAKLETMFGQVQSEGASLRLENG
jgi:hypothetical protein